MARNVKPFGFIPRLFLLDDCEYVVFCEEELLLRQSSDGIIEPQTLLLCPIQVTLKHSLVALFAEIGLLFLHFLAV